MDVAPGPLTRTFTAPVVPSSHSRLHNSSGSSINAHHQSHPGSSYSSFSHPSRASDSTQDTTASTLFPQPPSSTPQPLASGLIGASNNVINRVADKESSLLPFCMGLRNRLRAVPGFEQHLIDVERDQDEQDDPVDPVSHLWQTFRRGYPLMTVYNALQPDEPLEVDESKVSEARRPKAAAFKFLQACVNKLEFPTEECFIITDLYGEDTSGFVKVAKVVSRVVDILVERGLIDQHFDAEDEAQGGGKRTQKQHIVDELVRTERTYVQHLEVLHSFKKFIEQRGIIPGDAIHDIFLNLNALLDFQRRFLIRVEQTNALPEEEQNWGQLFKTFGSAFRVYEQYIANQKNCEDTAMREFETLRNAGGPPELRQIVESPTHLTSFLLKPFQRLSKYPLLLKELRDKGDLDDQRKQDISEGMEVCQEVLERTNDYIAKQERADAVTALKNQVEDWKDHRIEAFGELLLYGTFTVYKSDATNSEREYRMYLFEKILLCCKDITNKPKSKIINKPSSSAPAKGKSRMAMKGRIFMQNVTETVCLVKPGSYTCQILWRGDSSIEYFIVRFPTEEVMKKWRNMIEKQRRECQEHARRTAGRVTSETEFSYMREHGQIDNPHREGGEADGEGPGYVYNDQPDLIANRHDSSTSLRSRSTTGDSGPPMPQGPGRGKVPPGATAPLTLRTQQLNNTASMQGEKPPPSFFSPTAESPISSRTSSSSGVALFPRQTTPSNQFPVEESNRFTAPAPMTRPLTGTQNGYPPTDTRQGRPSHTHTASLSQTRLRSASSPDVHSQNQANRRTPSNAPPVPNLPTHIAAQQQQQLQLQQAAQVANNRSQSNSPIYSNGVPSRASAQSPNSKLSMGEQRPQTAQYQIPNGYESGAERGYSTASQTQRDSGTMSPPPATGYSLTGESPNPTNFKVKVEVPSEGSTMTLVVGFNISYHSLMSRIDAKLQRASGLSLQKGSARLQYLYDDEMVSIQTDEDVQTAFETWRESQRSSYVPSQLGEIKLYCNI